MNKEGCGGKDLAALDELIEEITVDAYGDDEKKAHRREAKLQRWQNETPDKAKPEAPIHE